MKRVQVITAVFAAAIGAAIAWSLPLPPQASSPAWIPVSASSACICPSAGAVTIASIHTRLHLPNA